MPDVRGGGGEEQSHVQGAVAARAERSYSTFKVRRGGCEEIPLVQGKEQWLCERRRAERSYSSFKVRRGGCEEIPLVQGKEQWLGFAGAAVKRHPMSKVKETQVRL